MSSSNLSCEVGVALILNIQMGKLRPREGKGAVQGHQARKWQSQDLHLGTGSGKLRLWASHPEVGLLRVDDLPSPGPQQPHLRPHYPQICPMERLACGSPGDPSLKALSELGNKPEEALSGPYLSPLAPNFFLASDQI